ncbi:MAG: DinB family protein [Anaerolineae bacterium]
MSTQEPQSQEEIFASYVQGPERLQAAIGDLSIAQLDLMTPGGGRTIRQIVHHIADADDLWKLAIKAAFGSPKHPITFQWYWDTEQADWAREWNYAARPVGPSLALLHANRRHIAQLLHAVPDAWDRSVIIQWPGRPEQRTTVRELIAIQGRHTLYHIDDILDIRRAHGIEPTRLGAGQDADT